MNKTEFVKRLKSFTIVKDRSKENYRLFSERRQELLTRQLSNSEAQDKAILMLSSSGLAISISIIRFVIELDEATNTWLLYWAWTFFAAAVISTILSYLIGQKAIDKWIDYSEKYYIEDDDDYEDLIPFWSKVNDKINFLSSIFFMLGVLLFVIFTSINLTNEKITVIKDSDCKNTTVTESKKCLLKGLTIMDKDKSKKNTITESAKIPTMEKKSATIPKPVKKPATSEKKK